MKNLILSFTSRIFKFFSESVNQSFLQFIIPSVMQSILTNKNKKL